MTDSKHIYDSFNARYLSFQDVADSFIENVYFNTLIENNHSILMGARGCGKTTLLKMLSPAAIKFWDQKKGTNLFNDIPFYGVYVPTDVHWKMQLDQLKIESDEKNFTDVVSRITVNLNILVSVIKTFSYLIDFLKEKNDPENILTKEVELSKVLIDTWKLEKPITPTLDSIEISLLTLVMDLNREIRKKNYLSDYKVDLTKYIVYDFFDLSVIAFSVFEKIFNELPRKNWAFCFDELEIAPEWLQFELLGFLRSRQQSILFKLTTAPIISLYKAIKKDFTLDAAQDNDYKIIRIWTSNRKEFQQWADFCHQLIRSRISRKYDSKVSPEEIFGFSENERLLLQTFPKIKSQGSKHDFEQDTPSWFLFKELARIDKTFEKFLLKKNISPNNPIPKNSKERDEIFRKIKQIALYRYQFKKEGAFKRSRKVIPLFYGIPFIFDFCDGNPRILIGLTDELLALAFKNDNFRQLTINEQSRILREISERYLSVISSHPEANATIRGRNFNIKDLLEQIGDFFHTRMIDDPFSMDALGSFRIDDDINAKLLELLELALYLGAIIYLDNTEPLSAKGILNKRFRLSYTLSPYFGLLSREFSDINLSTIFKRNLDKEKQQTLFDNDETI